MSPYDPRWPALYAEERERVEAVLGDLANFPVLGSTARYFFCMWKGDSGK